MNKKHIIDMFIMNMTLTIDYNKGAPSHPVALPALLSASSFPQDAPGSVASLTVFPLCPSPGKRETDHGLQEHQLLTFVRYAI